MPAIRQADKKPRMNARSAYAMCCASIYLLTLDVVILNVRDVAVHETGGVDRADVAGKRRQVRVTGVVKNVVFRGHNRKTCKGYVHLQPSFFEINDGVA